MHRCTNVRMYECTSVPMYRCTNIRIPLSLRYIGTSCTYSVVFRLCGTPVYFFYRGGTSSRLHFVASGHGVRINCLFHIFSSPRGRSQDSTDRKSAKISVISVICVLLKVGVMSNQVVPCRFYSIASTVLY